MLQWFALAISAFSLLFALAVLAYVLVACGYVEWWCRECGHYRPKVDEPGMKWYRRCDTCGRGWGVCED